MARGRMISNTLGRSHKFNALEDHITKLLYILALTHADAEGRIEADPRILHADCFPLDSRVGHEQVQSSLAELHKVGLIRLYTSNGKTYAEFVDFHEHNTITRHQSGPNEGKPSREAWSKIPPPSGKLPSWAEPDSGTHESRTSSSATTHEQPREAHAEVEVEFESEVEVQGEGEVARTRATPTPQDRPTSEEAFHQAATTGLDPTILEHKVRERIRRTAGKDFQLEHDHDIPRWSREHPPDRIDELWEAAKPEHWRGTPKADKRRIWIFEDLLNQDVQPPTEADDPLAQYTELGL